MESQIRWRGKKLRGTDIKAIEKALVDLQRSVSTRKSLSYCLQLWSRFIRVRDGNRCVVCHSRHVLLAHLIVRKSFMGEARFQTGNGITLCRRCHREPHQVF